MGKAGERERGDRTEKGTGWGGVGGERGVVIMNGAGLCVCVSLCLCLSLFLSLCRSLCLSVSLSLARARASLTDRSEYKYFLIPFKGTTRSRRKECFIPKSAGCCTIVQKFKFYALEFQNSTIISRQLMSPSPGGPPAQNAVIIALCMTVRDQRCIRVLHW